MFRPGNDIARGLLQRLDSLGLRDSAAPSLVDPDRYCVGVRARNLIEAFELGRQLGASFGKIRVESFAHEHIIAFPEALVDLEHGSA